MQWQRGADCRQSQRCLWQIQRQARRHQGSRWVQWLLAVRIWSVIWNVNARVSMSGSHCRDLPVYRFLGPHQQESQSRLWVWRVWAGEFLLRIIVRHIPVEVFGLMSHSTFLSVPHQLGEGCGVKETPQQKYQRLVNEIQELTEEVEHIQVRHRSSHTLSISSFFFSHFNHFSYRRVIDKCYSVILFLILYHLKTWNHIY